LAFQLASMISASVLMTPVPPTTSAQTILTAPSRLSAGWMSGACRQRQRVNSTPEAA
jgi:hypothetical protein